MQYDFFDNKCRRLKYLFVSLFIFINKGTFCQEINDSIQPYTGLLTDMADSSTMSDKNMISMYNKFVHIKFSGYLQPQFQVSAERGNSNIYQGGEWGKYSNNRFRLRRGRFRMDFSHYLDDGSPSVYFVFQLDGTERGVNIRDLWGRIYENKYKLFYFSTGMMPRPFGYEVLYSSSYRESPERGRMSQTIMKTERDLGFMVSLNPRNPSSKMKWLGVDFGIFNGQGLTGPLEYDSRKDMILHISSKRTKIGKSNLYFSGGISGLLGGITNQSPRLYSTGTRNGIPYVSTDSMSGNIGKLAKRQYAGADIQLIFPHKKIGQTELRIEYVKGIQVGTMSSSETPGTYPLDGAGNPQPLMTRTFDGGYIYFLQNIFNKNNMFVVKYDWYDPNTKVDGDNINTERGFSEADIRYNTWGIGWLRYINENLKLTFWYENPINERSKILGYDMNIKDAIATIRMQFSF